MKQGSNNEAPLLERLGTQDWVHEVYEIGMLEVIGSPWLAVSPDAIIVATVNSPDGMFQEEETPQIMFVEMKTRLGSGTIEKSMESFKTNGGLVHCCYGDDEFKACVPSGNRSQLIHQSMVTGLDYGVFVTSVADGIEAELLQMAMIKFTADDRKEHLEKVNGVGELLFGWLYEDELLNSGIVRDFQCPSWMNTDQRFIVSSQYPLWAALYCKIKNCDDDTDNYSPTYPVGTFKHFHQYNYNHGKWGVDKSTEMACHVTVDGVKVCFEATYILRMIVAIIIALWRERQSNTIVRPFVSEYRENNEGKDPSLQQIRRQLWKMPLDEFVFDGAIEILKFLQSKTYRDMALTLFQLSVIVPVDGDEHQSNLNIVDAELGLHIQKLVQKNNWPLTTRRLDQFHRSEELGKLRKHVSVMYPHNLVPAPWITKQKGGQDVMVQQRMKCALCVKGTTGRQTSKMCGTCEVPLCTTVLKGEDKNALTHFAMWHSCDNLKIQRDICHGALLASKANYGSLEGDEGVTEEMPLDDDELEELPALDSPVDFENFDTHRDKRRRLMEPISPSQIPPGVGQSIGGGNGNSMSPIDNTDGNWSQANYEDDGSEGETRKLEAVV
jgi:hypothetical protein